MKSLVSILAFLVVAPTVHAEVGSPTKVKCSVAKLIYKEDITKVMDINDLLQDSTRENVGELEAVCDTYQGQVTVCENIIEKDGIYMRYEFNTQNGSLEVDDAGTGQSTYMSWTNQDDVTYSGYLLGGTWLTNRAGGLMGSKRVFQVEADCWATAWK